MLEPKDQDGKSRDGDQLGISVPAVAVWIFGLVGDYLWARVIKTKKKLCEHKKEEFSRAVRYSKGLDSKKSHNRRI